jgi:phosphate starvation-inducible PhoH-like protein
LGVYHTAKRREDSELLAVGPAATRIAEIFDDLVLLSRSGHVVNTELVEHAITAAARGARSTDIMNITVFRNARGRTVRPITTGQRSYVEAVAKNTITFGLGPAGSGKSFLAVASAVSALQQHHVRRIILTRPAVEAGEHLGFLPGDLMAKVDPYLRPLFDALDDLLGPDQTARYLDTGIIEVAPLASCAGEPLMTPLSY